MNRILVLASLALALLLAACGNKGPLVLPAAPAEETVEPGAPQADELPAPPAEDGAAATGNDAPPAEPATAAPPADDDGND
ncbi:lipoprotein [Vulcaniibacterium thermophilum]|uniref:Sugar transporter n=1 Tax=Vulcaniibacterium thermophilum TaxID=1169913 RepID=A0A918Z9V8_9GAMM|nr:lipoprotein [Vulcaniibacterium thermophilum]GHE40053.1 hypothetical protein GCM10007167_22710 [Vulcaniibacterium thermophilum]